jgi:hypothetical protein
MKKVFLFSVLALVCAATCMTSCSKDDDGGVAQTGVTVLPTTIKRPVGQGLTVEASAVPENATLAPCTWTSQDESIATVSNSGAVMITGVGTTTITVTSGSFSKTIPVEGTINSLTIKDSVDNSSGTYPYNGTPLIFTLTLTTIPVGADVTPIWSSSAEHVTVEAATNGLSATVTISGEGAASITADASGVTGSYAISTTSVFESAVGYWEFNDPADIGKATRGTPLTYSPEQFVVVGGPSTTKKAVRITGQTTWRGAEEIQGLMWDHPITDEEKLQNYTVLMDARITSKPVGNLYVVYESGTGVAAVAFKSRAADNGGGFGELTVNQGGSTKIYYAREGTFTPGEDYEPNEEPWVRLVFTVSKDAGDNTSWSYVACIDGKITPELCIDGSHPDIIYYRLNAGVPMRFLMGEGPSETNHPFDVSTIAVWDRVLTKDEIASLGGVSK